MPKRKCVVCGNYIEDNADSVPYKNRYAHSKCFEGMVRMAGTQKKKELSEKANKRKNKNTSKKNSPKVESIKEAVSEEEYKEKVELYNYLRKITEQEELSAKTYVLINSYIEKYSFSYSGIKQTLEYYFEIKGNTVESVGIVPYYYTEAKKYYSELSKIEEESTNKNIEEMYNIKTIRVPSQQKKQRVQLLDIESIGVTETKES